MIDYFLKENVFSRSLLKKIVIDKDNYMKVTHSKPCLTNEIRWFFLGIPPEGWTKWSRR